jgi:hypothetical protein
MNCINDACFVHCKIISLNSNRPKSLKSLYNKPYFKDSRLEKLQKYLFAILQIR